MIERARCLAEFVALVRSLDGLRQLGESCTSPRVQRARVAGSQLAAVVRRIEVRQVREKKAQGIANLPILVGRAREEGCVGPYVTPVAEAADPPAAHIRTVLAKQILHRKGVVTRLAHLQAARIYDESVGQQRLEGRSTACSQRREQRGLKPAAMLIGALQVEVRRIAEFAFAQHGVPGGAALEPYVEDVVRGYEALLANGRLANPIGRVEVAMRVVAGE